MTLAPGQDIIIKICMAKEIAAGITEYTITLFCVGKNNDCLNIDAVLNNYTHDSHHE